MINLLSELFKPFSCNTKEYIARIELLYFNCRTIIENYRERCNRLMEENAELKAKLSSYEVYKKPKE